MTQIGNLGAGVQSTTIYLLEMDGFLPPSVAWVFADTGEEPKAVYRHLEWLESLGGPRIIRTGRNVRLGDQLTRGVNASGQRFVSIPAFLTGKSHEDRQGESPGGCEYTMMQRQCTKEYKIEVIERAIRRQVFGLLPRRRVPKGTCVVQLFGLSDDEPTRIRKVKANYLRHPWASPRFPLAEMGWTRQHCREYLANRVPHEVPRSACVFCPYRSAVEWERLKNTDPEGWARAVEIDRALRDKTLISPKALRDQRYLHRSCLPLEVIDFAAEADKERAKPAQPDLFRFVCVEGMCGV